jgi:hypothetical protein
MRIEIVITFIVGGVIVVALPPLSDAWRAFMVTRLLERGSNSVMLEGRMEDIYRFGCWALGALMIGVAVIGSFVPSRMKRE